MYEPATATHHIDHKQNNKAHTRADNSAQSDSRDRMSSQFSFLSSRLAAVEVSCHCLLLSVQKGLVLTRLTCAYWCDVAL